MALLALALVLAGAAHPGDRRPVPLRNPPLVAPVEAAGTGVAPEVTVRVEVDARGRAAKVEVLKIQPSTALDDAFRAQAVRTLSEWRFAPAIAGGEAVPGAERPAPEPGHQPGAVQVGDREPPGVPGRRPCDEGAAAPGVDDAIESHP